MQHVTPESLLERMLELGEQLQSALKQHQWEAVAGIDLQVRDCLLAMPTAPSAELQLAKQQLHQLYGRVIPAYSEACEKLRVILLAHLEHAEGRTAYLRTDLMQGER